MQVLCGEVTSVMSDKSRWEAQPMLRHGITLTLIPFLLAVLSRRRGLNHVVMVTGGRMQAEVRKIHLTIDHQRNRRWQNCWKNEGSDVRFCIKLVLAMDFPALDRHPWYIREALHQRVGPHRVGQPPAQLSWRRAIQYKLQAARSCARSPALILTLICSRLKIRSCFCAEGTRW